MGQRKFRLSDMLPNSWFYKLRDMRRAGGRSGAGAGAASSCLGAKGSTTRQAGSPRPVPVSLPHRSSYYYASRDRMLQPTSTAAVIGKATAPEPAPVARAPEEAHRHHRRDTRIGRDATTGGDGGKLRKPAAKALPSRNLFAGKVITSDTDIIFDLRADGVVPERVLRPIVTSRPARREVVDRCELNKEGRRVAGHRGAVTTPARTSSASEQGSRVGNSRRSSVSSSSGRRLKTRANSPRLTSRRGRKGSKPTTNPKAPPPPLAESFAVVKASVDPRRDFRESMEEMIAEKGIRGAGDLEDLLACYLSLNAAKHHDLIVEVFEEIWASLAGLKP